MPGTVLFWGIWGSAHGFGALCIFLLALSTSLSSGWTAWVSTMFWACTLSLGITFDKPLSSQIWCLWRMSEALPTMVWSTGPHASGDVTQGAVPPAHPKARGAQRALPPRPMPCRAGGRCAAAFPTLHNFHFNGFSFFPTFAACQLPFFIVS